MRRRPLVVSVAASLLLFSCSAGAAEPGGPDGVLLQYHLEGGFVPVEWELRRGPVYTLTTDGRLISEGPTIAIYPGPLLTGYFMVNLTKLEVRQLRSLIDRIGLPGLTDEHDSTGSDVIADANTEVFTYWDSNGAHRFSAYAPGTVQGPPSPRIRAFLELRDALSELSFSRESAEYVPSRVRVLAGQVAEPEPDFSDVRDWPLPDSDIAGWAEVGPGWVCRVFDPSVLPPFGNASQATTWRLPGQGPEQIEMTLLVRPLLPGEPDCQGG
jgi:hypothetical protein